MLNWILNHLYHHWAVASQSSFQMHLLKIRIPWDSYHNQFHSSPFNSIHLCLALFVNCTWRFHTHSSCHAWTNHSIKLELSLYVTINVPLKNEIWGWFLWAHTQGQIRKKTEKKCIWFKRRGLFRHLINLEGTRNVSNEGI